MTTKREPSDESVLAARIIRAYPSLSAYSAASLATELCAIERAQRRHAVRCCNGDYVKSAPLPHNCNMGPILVHDPDAERKAGARIERMVAEWLDDVRERCEDAGSPAPAIDLQDEPRGPVLLVRLPGETEAVSV